MTENKHTTTERRALDTDQFLGVCTKPLPQSSWGWFREGFTVPMLGLRLLFQSKGLLGYFIIPVAIQTVVSLAILGLLLLVGKSLVAWIKWLIEFSTIKILELTGQAGSIELSGWSDLLLKIVIWVPIVLFFLYLFVILWRVTGGVLTGYFGGRLTDKLLRSASIELPDTQQTTFPGEVFNAWAQAALIAIPNSMIGGLLNMVPFVGTLAAIPIVLGYTIFVTGLDELRDPLQKLGLSRVDALRTCWRHRFATIGLGLAKLITQPIPLIGGLVQTAESLGRISLAIRIMKVDRTGYSALSESRTLPHVPTTFG